MTWVTLAPARDRAGHLGCVCDMTPPSPTEGPVEGGSIGLAAAGFALAVLGQALTTAVLPVAGSVIAPGHAWPTLPYALTLVGAVIATLPAALLADVLGRRGALALGASLGLAGGCIAAWSFAEGRFAGLVLGSLWLGIAQGFGFFYRHTAALGAGDRTRAIALVLGAGSAAAVVAPALVRASESLAGPLAPAAVLLCAGLLQTALVALTLLPQRISGFGADHRTPVALTRILAAGLAGAAAWFGMACLMARAPTLMAQCGVGAVGTSGIVAWHILWMYAPAAIAGHWLRSLGSIAVALIGLALVLAGLLAIGHIAAAAGMAVVMAFAGTGWSLAMLGLSAFVHERGSPSPALLALHDALLLSGAVGGALVAGL